MKKLEKFQAGLTTLAWLDIGDEGVKRMAPLTQLKDLRVALTTIKDPKCFEALVNLESLDLNDTYVLDSSLAPLANMKNLRRLTLVGTLITDDRSEVPARPDQARRAGSVRRQDHRRRRRTPSQD